MMKRQIVLFIVSLVFIALSSADDHCRECERKDLCCHCSKGSCKQNNRNANCDGPPGRQAIRACENVQCRDECLDDRRRHGDNDFSLDNHLSLGLGGERRDGDDKPCCIPEPESKCPKPSDDAEECGGSAAGECEKRGTQVRCKCNQGFQGSFCANSSAFMKSNEKRKDKFEDMSKKIKDYFDKRENQCNESFPVLCRSDDDIVASLRGTCQEIIVDCYGGNRTLYNIIKGMREDKCEEEQQLCALDGCIADDVPCSVVSQGCPANKPFRCADWKCKKFEHQCESAANICPGNKVICADSVTCADSEEDCARSGIQWEGCGAGLVECPGMPGRCANGTAQCEEFGGCPEGKTFCGIKRDGKGRAVMKGNTGLPQPICKDECTNVKPKATPAFGELKKNTFGKLVSLSARGLVAVVLETTRLDSFTRADNMSGGVNFSITPVADSLVQHGAFRSFFKSGALMSQPILIEPSAEVVIEGGFLLEIPVLDDSIVNESMCLQVLEKLSIVTVQDITKLDAEVELVSMCERGSMANCSCAVNLSHFSTYTVVDGDTNQQAGQAQTLADGEEDAASSTTAASTTAASTTAAAAGNDGEDGNADEEETTTPTPGGNEDEDVDDDTDTTTAAGGAADTTAAAPAAAGTTGAPAAAGTTGAPAAAGTTGAPAAPVTTPAPTPTGFALKVSAALAGMTAIQLRANLGGFRAAVAKVHAGKTAADVIVDEASIQDVTTARRRLLADGVSVDYTVQGFASETEAASAKTLQEAAATDLVANLKDEGFASVTGVTSTVAVTDASGSEIEVTESGVAAVWASWTCTVLAAVAVVVSQW